MPKKQKILFRIGSMRGGGAERVLLNVLHQLDPEKFEVDLLLNIKFGTYLAQIPKHVRLFWINELPKSQNKVLANIHKLKSIFREKHYFKNPRQLYQKVLLGHVYDVEVAFSHDLEKEILASPNPKSTKILWIHADVFLNKKATPNYLAHVAQHDKIVVVSDYLKADFIKNCPDISPKLSVIYNALDAEQIITQSQEAAPKVFASPKPTFCSIGTLSSIKGHAKLIEAFAAAHKNGFEGQLMIVGNGPEKAHLEKLIAQHQAQDYIQLMGFQQNPFAYLIQADYYIHSSEEEGFGNVLIEALVLQKPIITTEIRSAAEILQDGKFGLIVPHHELQLGIEKAIASPELMQSFKQNIIQQDLPYNLDKIMHKIENLLLDC
jgi:glycosyltransferase involved in cell wall biosynthesis